MSASLADGALAELSAAMSPGEWLLLPRPMSAVLPNRSEVGSTTWGRAGSKAVVRNWNGAAYDTHDQRLLLHGGGGANYGGNGVYEFSFRSLQWRRLADPYILPAVNPARPCPYPTEVSQGPRSAQSFDSLVWSVKLQRMLYWNLGGYCLKGKPPADPYRGTWSFDAATGNWSFSERVPAAKAPESKYENMVGHTSTAELTDGEIVIADREGVYRIDPLSMKVVGSADAGRWGRFHQLVAAPDDNRLFLNSRKLHILDSRSLQLVEMLNIPADARVQASSGMAFDADRNQLVFWEGRGDVVVYDVEKREWRWTPAPSGPVPEGLRPLSKWVYLKDLNLFAGVSRHDDGVWFYRLPAWQDLQTLPETSLQQQIDQQAGPLIRIEPGTYRMGAVVKRSGVTIDGGGSRVSGVVRSKGVFLLQGNDIRLENFAISLGPGEWVNDACVRIEGMNIAIADLSCKDTQMGILTGGRAGKLLIERVEISRTGINLKGNLGHAIYACANKLCQGEDQVVIRESRFSDIGVHRPGHVVKSRAPLTLVSGNVMATGLGKTGRHVELPNGGRAIISGNTFWQGAVAENNDLVTVGLERFKGPSFPADVIVEDNDFKCPRKSGCHIIAGKFAEGDLVLVRKNTVGDGVRVVTKKSPYVLIR